jgi:RHS repeat-associated protein
VAGFTLSYDANGNFVSGAGNGVVWTSFNKPASITTPRGSASFTYDADHNRLTKTAGGSTTVYIGKLYEKVIGGVDRHYVYAAGRLVCVVEGQAVRYMHADHLGSVSVITNELGQVLERLSFDAFGRPRNPNGTDGAVSSAYSKRGFTGHEMDSELSLINMNARLYSPVLGRFISADTIVPNPGNMQDFNRYAYVNNNPLLYIDPTGHWKLKNLWREVRRWVPVVLVAAASFYTGGYAMAAYQGVTFSGAVAGVATAGSYSFAGLASMSMGTAMVGGAVGGAIASSSMTALAGGSFDQIVQAGLLGGVGGAIGAGIGFQFAQYGMSGFGRMAGQSLSAGVQSDFDPRSMGRAFLMAGVASGASYVYDKIVGFGVEWKGGDRAIDKGRFSPPQQGRINIGFASSLDSTKIGDIILGEGRPVSQILNFIPGLNSAAGFHDQLQIFFDKLGGVAMRNALNIPGMIPSTAITYTALLGVTSVASSLAVDDAHRQ